MSKHITEGHEKIARLFLERLGVDLKSPDLQVTGYQLEPLSYSVIERLQLRLGSEEIILTVTRPK